MEIGIISINMYSKGLNFACPLHTYAFQQFLLANGFKSTVINYKPVYYDNFNLQYPFAYYAERLGAAGRKKAASDADRQAKAEKIQYYTDKLQSWLPLIEERSTRYEKFQAFIEHNYVKTDICYDSDLLEIEDPGFDCYICATDVIWKNQPNSGFDRGYFLASSCMDNKWKLAYAASRGVYFAENQEEEALFFQYLSDLDFISVREKSLQNYIAENMRRTIPTVLDPVLLHDADFYDRIIVRPKEEHYLLLYYVMEKATTTISQAVAYARAHHLKIVEITDLPVAGGRLTQYTDLDRVFRYDIGIEEWLGYFKYADCIFTNSFHACCFSILFHKNLFVGHRNGDKVKNVLELFGLSGRLITASSDLIAKPLPEIDYEKVQKILDQKREESASLILSALRSCETKPPHKKDYDAARRSLTYPVVYNTKLKNQPFTWDSESICGKVRHLASGSLEYVPKNHMACNDGSSSLLKNPFHLENYHLKGWYFRFRIDNRWFWYLEDGSLLPVKQYQETSHKKRFLFPDMATLPYIPVKRISSAVVEAVWEKSKSEAKVESSCRIYYNSGMKTSSDHPVTWNYDESSGSVYHLATGTLELHPKTTYPASAFPVSLLPNGFYSPDHTFAGWRIRFLLNGNWFYFTETGSVSASAQNAKADARLFADQTSTPVLPDHSITLLVAEAVWTRHPKKGSLPGMIRSLLSGK